LKLSQPQLEGKVLGADFLASLVCGPSPAGGCERSEKQPGVAKRAASVFTLAIVAAIVAPGSTLRAVPSSMLVTAWGLGSLIRSAGAMTYQGGGVQSRASGKNKGHPPAVGKVPLVCRALRGGFGRAILIEAHQTFKFSFKVPATTASLKVFLVTRCLYFVKRRLRFGGQFEERFHFFYLRSH